MSILFVVATLPGLFLAWYVYQQDKIEKEPTKLLQKLFNWGMLTVFAAILLETIAGFIIGFVLPKGTILYNATTCFLGVALIEEGLKYYVLKRYTWNHPAFDYRFDAIVYAVCASMGFAVLENIFYVFSNGLDVGIARAFTSLPGHCIFGIYMGYYYGAAKEYAVRGKILLSKSSLTQALWVPMVLHGFYDFCLSDAESYIVIFLLFVLILDYRAYKSLKKWSREDHSLY